MSNINNFKHEWVWNKVKPGAFTVCKYRPLRQHEDILIFSNGKINYNPIKIPQQKRKGKIYGKSNSAVVNYNDGIERNYNELYPKTIIEFSNADNTNKFHPTQKPVALCEYLIKTYSNESDTILDNTMGSGTTGVACVQTNRNFIGIERDEKYFEIATERISKAKPTIETTTSKPNLLEF